MFNNLLQRLLAPSPAALPDEDARRALGALLVRLARADGEYAQSEIAQIDTILAQRYDLSPDGASALRAECEQVEADAPDTVRFTRAIKDAVAYEDRIAVIESMWELALADGQRDQAEDALLRMVSPMLGVSDTDNARARQRVAARMS